MARNLCTSSCCGNVVRLSDLRGKPIEFRRYDANPPVLGTRWNCPSCNTAYFACWKEGTKFAIDLFFYESFDNEHDYDDALMALDVGIEPDVRESQNPMAKDTIQVYLNYWGIVQAWKTKNPGEAIPIKNLDTPAYLCLDDAEDAQEIL
jgi:hypothetical protein